MRHDFSLRHSAFFPKPRLTEAESFKASRFTVDKDGAFDLRDFHRDRSGNRRLRELDWKSLPCVKLPLPSFRWDQWRRTQKLPAAKDVLEVQAAGWRLKAGRKGTILNPVSVS